MMLNCVTSYHFLCPLASCCIIRSDEAIFSRVVHDATER